MKRRLKQLRDRIDREVDYVDIKPYSHNIISLTLQTIDKEFGRKEANKALIEFGLEDLGWSCMPEKENI